MRTCPVCGFHNSDMDTRCARCSGALAAESVPEAADFARKRAGRRGPSRFRFAFSAFPSWSRYSIRLRAFLDRMKPELPRDAPDRNQWKAAFLSLIPGVGQLYNFQPLKAAYFLAVWIVMGSAAVLTIREPWSNRLLLAFIAWILYAFHDGFRTAARINRRYWTAGRSIAVYLTWVFLLSTTLAAGQWVLFGFALRFTSIQQAALAPAFEDGDRVTVDQFSYLLRDPRPGEIVLYRPEDISIEMPGELGNDVYGVKRGLGVERVLAGPGQHFARRGDLYFRDGVQLPPGHGPIVTSEVTWDYEFDVPDAMYLVLYTYTGVEMVSISGTGGRFQAPPLNRGIVKGWEEACLVPESKIIGRIILIHHPPPRRRLVRSP